MGASFFSFGASIIATRVLGPHGRGLLAVLIAVPGVIGIMGLLGLDTANLRFAGRSHSAFRQVVRRAVGFSATVGTAMGAGWWIAGSVWLPVRLGLGPGLALLCAALCPASLLFALLGTAEVGRGRTAVYNLVIAGTMAVYLIGVVVLQLRGQLSVVACFGAYGASQVLGIIALLVLSAKRVHPDGECVPVRQYGSYALRAYLPNVVQYGMLRMDVPVIQVLAGTTAVALYAVALPFAEALLLLPVAVGLVLFPQVTSGAVSMAAAGRIRVAVLATTLGLGIAIAAAIPVIVPRLYGSAFSGSVGVIWCMLPGLVMFSAARTTQTYLAGTDNLRPVVMASVAGVAAGLISLLALVTRFGAIGAGVADSAGYAAFAIFILAGRRMGRPLADAVTRSVSGLRGGASRVARSATAQFSNVRAAAYAAAAALALGSAVLSTRSTATTTAVLGMVLLLIVAARPDTGLYVLAVAIPVSQTSFGITLISVKDLLVLVIACVVGRIAAGRVTPQRARAVVLGAALVCYFLVSDILVGGGGGGSQDVRGVLTLSIVLLSLPLIARADVTTRRAVVAFAFSAACVALVEIPTARSSVAASGNIAAVNSAAVAAGQTGALNHNTEGAFFVLALCVLLAFYSHTRRILARIAVAVAIAVLIAGVAYSYSRSAYFGALAVIAVFALRRSIRGLISAGLIAVCLVPLAPATVLARLGTVWNSSSLGDSSATRLDLWTSAIRMFIHEPVLGVGYLHFSVLLPAYYLDTSAYAINTIDFSGLEYAHNTFLTVLSQTGLVGAVLVGVLVVAGWRRAWSASKAGDWAGESAILAMIGIALCSFFGEPLFEMAVLAAFLLVVLAARKSKEAGHGRSDRDTATAARGVAATEGFAARETASVS